MSWVRVDDKMTFHAKVVHAGNEAVGAWLRMTTWSAAHLTDGHIPAHMALLIAGRMEILERLVEVRLLENEANGYAVHDYHDHNPTADEVRAQRSAISEARARAGKVGGLSSGQARAKQSESKPRSKLLQANEAIASDSTKQNEAPSRPDPVPLRVHAQPKAVHQWEFQDQCEQIYRDVYPRHEGKTRGMKTAKSTITSQVKFEAWSSAVRNYALHVNGREKRHIKQFDSFMSVWEDYVEFKPAAANGSSRLVAVRSEPPQRQYKDYADALKELEEIK